MHKQHAGVQIACETTFCGNYLVYTNTKHVRLFGHFFRMLRISLHIFDNIRFYTHQHRSLRFVGEVQIDKCRIDNVQITSISEKHVVTAWLSMNRPTCFLNIQEKL